MAIAARATIAGLVALILLELLWEIFLAPLPGSGRWLALKALPLMFLLPGVAHGARKPRQWLVLLAPLYFAEAVVRAWSEGGRHGLVAGVAAAIAVATFGAGLAWFALERRARSQGLS